MKITAPCFLSIGSIELEQLILRAEATREECCGFLLGHDNGIRVVTHVVPTANIAPTQRHMRFEVDPLEYLRAEKYACENELTLLGIYHSHPSSPAIPSETDRSNAQPYFSYVILSLSEQSFSEIRSWRLNHSHQFEEETVIL
ncbi:MAG: M67 family metallopeptidase [Chryseolinea sp.]